MSNGLFITFEGIDASGKSLQAKLLQEKLENAGQSVILIRDPGTTKISEKVRAILLDVAHAEMSPWTELLLYEAARAQMVKETILPAIEKGKVVLCDRFYDSTTAYQGYGRQLDLDLVTKANQIGSGGLVPDLTFIIDLSPQLAAERKAAANMEADRLEAEHVDFHNRVAAGYRQIALAEPARTILVNGDRQIDVIHAEIIKLFQQKYPDIF